MHLSVLLSATLVTNLLSPYSQWWIDDYELAANFTGEGVVVAVIDTGVDSSHPDLAGTLLGGADFSGAGKPNGGAPVGPSGYHGTMVASLIAGQGNQTGGVIGIAPRAKLLSISIGLGLPDADTDRQIAQAVRWAADNGADVINLSISRNSQSWPASWDAAFLYAMQRDIVIVAASGNESANMQSATAPATIPGVVSVTAVNQEFETVAGSGARGVGVNLAAPGVDMIGSFPGGGSRNWSGSSAAAPIVSGLVALMRQADPSASASDIISRLITTATDLGEPGFDSQYGFGLINPQRALASAEKASVNPLGSLEEWIRLYRPGATEEAADLQIPTPVEVDSGPNIPINPTSSPEPWSNPLLYILLVPLALLLLMVYHNRAGRVGKKKTRR